MKGGRRIDWLDLVGWFAAIAGSAFVLAATRTGIGLAPDSAAYLSAACNLLVGRGLLLFDGSAYVNWPPLYPALLALAGLARADILLVARVSHAVAFGATILLSGRLLRQVLSSSTLVAIGLLFVLLSHPLQASAGMLLSESFFCLLALVFISAIAQFLESGRPAWLAVCCLAAALLVMQRYIGLAFVFGAAPTLLFMPRGSALRRRLAHTAFVFLAGTLPVVAWMLRNYLSTGSMVGERLPAVQNLLQKLLMTFVILYDWFLPRAGVDWLAWTLLILFSVIAVFLAVSALRRRPDASYERTTTLRASSVLTLVYVAALVASASVVSYDEISNRLLAPVYVPLVLVGLAGTEALARDIGRRVNRTRTIRAVALTVCGVLLLHPLYWTVRIGRQWIENGVGVYSQPEWRRSRVLAWLRENHVHGRILSNDPAAVYLLAGKNARMSPRSSEIGTPDETVLRSGDHLAWFTRANRPYLVPASELVRRYRLQGVAMFDDGGVMICP